MLEKSNSMLYVSETPLAVSEPTKEHALSTCSTHTHTLIHNKTPIHIVKVTFLSKQSTHHVANPNSLSFFLHRKSMQCTKSNTITYKVSLYKQRLHVQCLIKHQTRTHQPWLHILLSFSFQLFLASSLLSHQRFHKISLHKTYAPPKELHSRHARTSANLIRISTTPTAPPTQSVWMSSSQALKISWNWCKL